MPKKQNDPDVPTSVVASYTQ